VGAVHFDGPIEIEGTVEGEIHCSSIEVARYGTVMGKIVADQVTVSGGVSGSIFANRLVLKPDCDVEGEIYHRELSLEQGSYFDGKSRPHKDPLSLAETPPVEEPELRLAG
jgi:cytoskeletal protein CcmA (bactofilin family)